jgi:hypothetical protein
MKEGFLVILIDQVGVKQRHLIEGCYIGVKRKTRQYFPYCYIQNIEPWGDWFYQNLTCF